MHIQVLSVAVSKHLDVQLICCLPPGRDKTEIQRFKVILDRSEPGVTWSSWCRLQLTGGLWIAVTVAWWWSSRGEQRAICPSRSLRSVIT